VTSLKFRGRPVAPTDSFTLALNNYRQTGGGGYAMLRGAPVVYDRQQEIRQLLIDEVRRRRVLHKSDFDARNWSMLEFTAKAATQPRTRPK
jgi:2',3'-cyclic-nucleotide 2'-phosphodiesterase/3'-nucleotidase